MREDRETKSATDEEIAKCLAALDGDEPQPEDALIRALIARIDAERERAQRWRGGALERDALSSELHDVETERDAERERAEKAERFGQALLGETAALKAQLAEARQQIAALREALNEAHPYVEMAEFLGSRAFSYGTGYPEPSPAEWGIAVAYVQTAEQMPHEQFADEVDAYHQMNREDDDGSGEFLTLANKLAALAQTEGAEG